MGLTPDDAGELLRARGMRSTPQRRAILSVFRGGRTEHLSADEVYAQASRSLPDLSRGTVYATLAEFSELGLLSAFGSPEPVRYETNVEPHAHFRCHLCLRVFDLVGGQQDPGEITDPGFIVERVETRAEGICDECIGYDAGLRAGARSILTVRARHRRAGDAGDGRLGARQPARRPAAGRHPAGPDPCGVRRSRRCRCVADPRRRPPREPGRPSAPCPGDRVVGAVLHRRRVSP